MGSCIFSGIYVLSGGKIIPSDSQEMEMLAKCGVILAKAIVIDHTPAAHQVGLTKYYLQLPFVDP
jgi:hypothetical protein